MLLQTFKLKEIVQILDPETYIWESAKIKTFISDWSLKIQWIDWNNRLQKIEIPLELRPDPNRWNIRKARHSQPVMSKKNSKPLSYNPNRLQKNEPVTFWLVSVWGIVLLIPMEKSKRELFRRMTHLPMSVSWRWTTCLDLSPIAI